MKSFRVKEDLHQMVFDKRDEIKKTKGIELTVESMVDKILREGIQNFKIE